MVQLAALCLSLLHGVPQPHKRPSHPQPCRALMMARYRVQHAQAMLLKAETDTECEAAYANLEAAKAALSKMEK